MIELQSNKYLTFTLGREEYGISIQKVKEIIGMMEITHIPRTPEFIKGVINLRGKIIPLMDLRLKFGLEEKMYNERTCVIVVEVYIEETVRYIGVVVDTVSEVVDIHKDEVEPPPKYGTQIDDGFLRGIGKVKDRVILLLDIEKILDPEEMVLLKNVK